MHENSQLSEIDKFTFLKGLLGGEASTTIAGLSLTQGNYGATIEVLKKRPHGNVFEVNSSAQRKRNPGNFESCMMKLKFGSEDCKVWGFRWIHMEHCWYLFSCRNYLEISRGVEDGKWNLDDFLKKLIAEITARERCTTPVNSAIAFGPKKTARLTTSTFLAPNGGGSESRCAFCMGLHKHVDCRKIVRVAERKQIAKRFGCCFVCLGQGHKAVCCDSRKKCHCGGRHRPALCESKFRESRDENRVQENTQVSESLNQRLIQRFV